MQRWDGASKSAQRWNGCCLECRGVVLVKAEIIAMADIVLSLSYYVSG